MKCALSLIALCLAVLRVSRASPADGRRFGSQLILEAGSEADGKMTVFQLPRDVEPVSYELHVAPQMDKAAFEGHVKITVRALSETSKITLNAKYIKLAAGSEPVRVTRINTSRPRRPEKIPVHSTAFDEANEQLVIVLDKALSRQEHYLVEIDYAGTLGDDMTGFYLSRYTNAGKEKLLATTQFEATGARRAFPCFDEPLYKTPFTIKVTRDKVQKSISNLPLKTTVPVANSTKETDTFKESPRMPTYLVAFAVFEFDSISNQNQTFRVWGREDVIKKQGQYIFEKGQKILSALSDYMGINYYSVMPKMDLVAVPDFDAGAMENWGMNTYSEGFFFKDAYTTEWQRRSIFSLATHELSHQWFGNLVTPSWWCYAWLKESVADYFEYFGVSLVEPTWRMEDLFVVEQVQVAFQRDELKDSHAMTSKTTTPQSIADTFDHIIYNKGGSVLRMIEHAVTPEIFKQSLRLYLKEGSSDKLKGTVSPGNLWEAFDDAIYFANASVLPSSLSSITEFVDEWTNKPGFPLVTVTRNYSSNIATLTQQRFLLKKSDMDADKTRWTIPITYTTKNGGPTFSNQVWFLKTENSRQISLPNSQEWVLVNVKEVGFYRVNYDDANWALLIAQLNSDPAQIHVLNRAQILDDAFSLAQAGLLKLETALELTQYLHKETDFIPWYSVYSHLHYFLRLYAGTELGNQMKTYITTRMDGIFNVLGLEDKATEESMSKIGRSTVSDWICQLGHSGCTSEAAHKFRDWIQAPESSNINPNIKGAVYCTGIRLGTKEQWTALWNYYLKTDLASEKIALLHALGCSQDEEILYNLLSKITGNSSEVRTQDHYILIQSVIEDPAGVKAALRFVKTQGPALLKQAREDELSPAEDNLKSIVSRVGASVRNQAELAEFTKILETIKNDSSIASYINKTLEHTADRFKDQATHQAALSTWFTAHTPSTTAPPPTSTPSPRPTTPPASPSTTGPTPPTQPTTPKPNSAALSLISKWFPLMSVLLYALC